jgi:cytochrome c2
MKSISNMQGDNASRAQKFSESCKSCNVVSQDPETEELGCADPCTPVVSEVIGREGVSESMGQWSPVVNRKKSKTQLLK